MKICLVGFILTAMACAVQAAEYKKIGDDFSNGTEYTITFHDTGNQATLFVKCTDEEKKFWVTIYINDVIFPDDVGDNFMYLNMMHKFDTAESAQTHRWLMPMMKYHSAQFDGDEKQFIAEGVAATRLAVKQSTSGASYRFLIDEKATEYLREVGAACGLL